MRDARRRCSRTLVVVAWILVQKRWQYRTAEHNVADGISSSDSKPLTITLRTLLEVYAVGSLANAGNNAYSHDRSWITEGFQSEIELQPGRHGRRVGLVGNIKVRRNPEYPLLLLCSDLLSGNFYLRISYVYAGCYACKPELAISQDLVLARLEYYFR